MSEGNPASFKVPNILSSNQDNQFPELQNSTDVLNALIATSDTAEIDKFFGTFIQKLTNAESPDGMFKLSTFNGMVAFLKRMVMKKYKVEKCVNGTTFLTGNFFNMKKFPKNANFQEKFCVKKNSC